MTEQTKLSPGPQPEETRLAASPQGEPTQLSGPREEQTQISSTPPSSSDSSAPKQMIRRDTSKLKAIRRVQQTGQYKKPVPGGATQKRVDQTGEQLSVSRLDVAFWPPGAEIRGINLFHEPTGETIAFLGEANAAIEEQGLRFEVVVEMPGEPH